MEEKECKEPDLEPEPGVQRAERTEAFSLIISAEEGEATPQRGALGDLTSGEDDMTNGHVNDDSQATSLCTSYWSVSESPGSPFLLSPVPGPSGRKPATAKPKRASRSGHSRIPGRDHRRYYHEYWRSEYLMDFDPRRHGMICMVCGSSLATLKLSTIKRHIRQKHPDSLLWSASDKEVIRSGWESHLNLEKTQTPFCPDSAIASEPEETLDCAEHSAGRLSMQSGHIVNATNMPYCLSDKPSSAITLKDLPESMAVSPPNSPTAQEPQGPSSRVLERYLNDSMHAWFRQEFLMEYQAEEGRLVCMVCGCPLPSLHLDHIKSHILELHPASLVYSAEEKHRVLQSWTQTHDPDSSRDFFKSEPDSKDVMANSLVQFFPPELDPIQDGSEPFAGDGGGEGGDQLPHIGLNQNTLRQFVPKRKLKNGCPWRLRLDYLIALGPASNPGCYCMVCSQQLPLARVSSFRRHIQECHPETSNLSRREREDIASAWSNEGALEEQQEHAIPDATTAVATTAAVRRSSSSKPAKQSGVKTENKTERAKPLQFIPGPGRHSHYPGKDQRRNYQVRWRMEYLMDYDCRRHGLFCMVCSATLATLKVSTIKRHIQQVHPHSLHYSAEEKQQALQSYNEKALHFVHSDDCFSPSDHSHLTQATVNASTVNTVRTSCNST